jgi:CBS-domain-containing membrane protein
VALAAAPLTPALAQSGPQADPVPVQAEVQYSDSDLESFVDAAMKVMALRQTYQARLQGAVNEKQQQALVRQAQEEMKAAIVQTDGIDVPTYTAIGEAAQADDALSQRITAMFQERMPGGGAQPSDGG